MKKIIFLIILSSHLGICQNENIKIFNPKKATRLSAIVPGLGQVYNKQYWKIPVIYGGYAVIGHYIKFNNDMYHEFKNALTYEIDDDASTINPFPNFSRNSLERNMDFWRRNRDVLIIFTGVYYLLNIVDAHIFAHLNEFDINNDLSLEIKPSINKINSKDSDESNNKALETFTNQFVEKVTTNLEKFRYNVIIANFYEMYNFLSKEINKPLNISSLKESYVKILKTMMPFTPHFTSECLNELSEDPLKDLHWPKIDKNLLQTKKVNIVVQINGKKREVLNLENNISEKEVMNIVLKNNKLNKFLEEKKISKKIFVQNRLINLIVN